MKDHAPSLLLLPLLLLLAPGLRASIPGLDEEDTRDGIRAPKPYYILEELQARTPIGNVFIDAKLSERYEKSALNQLRYQFLDQVDDRGNGVDLFNIGNKNGIVSTKVKIDRDEICPRQVQCLVHLKIGVYPQEYFLVIRVVVDILDVNDNAPKFPQTEIFSKMSESASEPRPSLTIPTASDPDSEAFSVKQYELISSSDRFQLIEEDNPDGTKDLRIVAGELDREQVDFYQFKVIAYDGADPPKSGSILINIEVLDANDNEPRFDNSTFEIFVLETVPVNTTIGRVVAQDRDLNSQITYGFASRTQHNYGHIFGIVKSTGAIFLKGSLDHEQGPSYVLSIIADDGGPHTRPATATVIIRVEDSNDNAPDISVNTLTSNRVAQVSESAVIGTFVAHVSVTDPDGGDNGRLECNLDHGNFDLERLDKGQYKVATAAKLNRERSPSFKLKVVCHDMGVQRKTSSATIPVQVLDSNDHAPVFSKTIYSASLKENNFVDDEIVEVSATDVDKGINGQVRYRLHSDALGLFRIHSIRGQVTANAIFDREEMPQITFRVIAYDQGSPTQSSTATIILSILDENDEPPTFVQGQYNFGIFENEVPGSEVGVVEAIDHDSAPFSQFSYKITRSMAGSVVDEAFKINSITGQLVTTKSLDREAQPVYYLTIEATSKRDVYPLTSSTASVTVYIADKNDNDPVIVRPTENNNTVYISNLTPMHRRVAHVHARDADLGDNAKITYQFSPNEQLEQYFIINPISGLITVKGDLRGFTYKMFQAGLVVKDHGYPQRVTEGVVNIVVNSTLVYMPEQAEVIVTNNNITIIVSLTSAFLILIFLAIIAIFLIKKTLQEYKCTSPLEKPEGKVRRESQKMLTPREETPDGSDSPRRTISTSSPEDPSTSQGRGKSNPFYNTWEGKGQYHESGPSKRGIITSDVEIDMGPDINSDFKKSNLKSLHPTPPPSYSMCRGVSQFNYHEEDGSLHNDELKPRLKGHDPHSKNRNRPHLHLPLESQA